MWNNSPEDRIREWRNFRIDLPTQNTLQCLYDVAKFWATAPQSNQFLAPDLPETWPNPWELLHDNYYDDIGLALGIYYTLLLSDRFNKEDIVFNVLDHKNTPINVVQVHDQVLNYDFGEVINTKQLPKDCKIKYQYDYKTLNAE